MKIDYVPGHADISEDMRKLALNMAAGGMAQKLQDTEQHKNAAGDTITALRRIAAKTGVEEKKVLEAYATAASNAAKDITGIPTPTDHQKTMQAALEGVQECIKENTKTENNIGFNFPPNSSNQTGSSRSFVPRNNSEPNVPPNSSNQNIEYTNNSINPRNPLDTIFTPDANAGTPPPGAKMLTPAQMQADAAAYQTPSSGGMGDAMHHLGQAMGVFAAVGGALTLMNWKHNHVLQNTTAALRTAAGIAGAMGASTPLGILAGTADILYNTTDAALKSTTQGREAARQAYQAAKEQGNGLKTGFQALRVAGAEVAYHKANALNFHKNQERLHTAVETTKHAVSGTVHNACKQLHTAWQAANKPIDVKKEREAMQNAIKTAKHAVSGTVQNVCDSVMAFLHFRWGKQAST
jgi:hypothetical protein